MSLEDNYKIVRTKINDACLKSNRIPSDVKIVAVTKYVDINLTKEALNIGLEHIGENRIQSALDKYIELQGKGIWHLIGQLQSNKVNKVIGKFDYIHSLDRLSLAKQIDKKAKQENCVVNCFIQVNISGEVTKTGVDPNNLIDFIKKIEGYKNIYIVGLMTMAPFVKDKELTRPIFRKLRELRDQLNDLELIGYPIRDLSMGMSNDFEIAIEEGATFIRIGSILFD